ncbi:nitrate/sulfonate/bicarbonate transporter ATP-binding protein [Gluconacetobacter johannae DSM 13595]|uniref:ABC transporter ATP-binding protein n=1 Tax=Gluconacetobacter johannae TaxID=112140 RepID=A0A7W4J802_9PROT|nr:ABC transporter ATP-binding protein [Gluconacetobacter johannae]MBB2176284.1 ABC transporter ATP-binding protein [Gluconacetobacter johannae]GBQ90586.1 nitrate/sulfonate/bicarbonate transporter ATP-binding protein [Gluconacetobacter johannae DSM 13595]
MSSITLQNVTQTYTRRDDAQVVLRDVSLSVETGEFLCVIGPSGCGKSTLLELMAGLERPSRGQVLVDGRVIEGPGRGRGVVFQQYALMPWLTALGNVEFGLAAAGYSRRVRRQRALEFLDLVGLAEYASRHPDELSGGMKQRVAIARSLAISPDILLMDEPFGALDPETRETLQDELLRLWRATGHTVVFITHDIDEALYLGRRVMVMARGPGRVAAVIDVPFADRPAGADVRTLPRFIELRQQLRGMLHDRGGDAHGHL